jgi:hypothetical protein
MVGCDLEYCDSSGTSSIVGCSAACEGPSAEGSISEGCTVGSSSASSSSIFGFVALGSSPALIALTILTA